MKVTYSGLYRFPAVSYRGVTFTKGEPSEVSVQWYEQNKGASIQIAKPKAKAKAKPKSAD